ncbi:hypothetical protein MYAM1_000964 [Malassezia yamatoensis]|uniref:Uncharacterized protein n=1 Tax=Malassezia yamatoensis TaxID=253288 RepID=A0AAJ5YPQ9_9BASI|nr:hypothetical protein MYAM1_000964 [Malassezia yamatoensis]
MVPILNEDSLANVQDRVAHKLKLNDDEPLTLKYLHEKELYELEDDDDFDIFVERFGDAAEADIWIESSALPQASSQPSQQSQQSNATYMAGQIASNGPNVPVLDESTLVTRTSARGKGGAISIHRVPTSTVPSADDYASAGGVGGGGRDSILYPPPQEATMPSYLKPISAKLPSNQETASVKSKKTVQTQSSKLTHSVAFEEFHSQRGVRLLRGSLGPVNNVPMMLKSGYRHVYVSRSFALDHGFIPADTTPGTYGYNGITNLGKWPVQVGSKAVPCTVMLAEDSYFPVILGRSFMEKRGVRTDPIDMTSVIFMDNGERADVEVVVVRDEMGHPVPIP